MEGAPVISKNSMKSHILIRAEGLSRIIMDELSGKNVSVKVDYVNSNSTSLMSVSVQFVKLNRLWKKTLAVKVFEETSNPLFVVSLQKIFSTFGIFKKNVYQLIPEMTKTIKIGKQSQMDSILEYFQDCPIEDSVETEKEEITKASTFNLSSFQEFFFKMNEGFSKIAYSMSHSLETSLDSDFLSEKLFKETIEILKNTTVKLKSHKFKIILKEKRCKSAILLDCSCWKNVYLMSERLMEMKSCCEELKDICDWDKISKLTASLKPLFDAIKFKEEYLIVSEIFAISIKLNARYTKLAATNDFAKILLEPIKRHSEKVFQDNSILAGVYLDPRFQVLLSEQQKVKAKNHILVVFDCLQSIENSVASSSAYESAKGEASQLNYDSDDDLGMLIQAKKAKLTIINSGDTNKISINNIIHSFDQIPIEDYKNSNFDIFGYWDSVPENFKDLRNVAFLIFSATASSISMQRSISSLKYVLGTTRKDIDHETLEAILFILLNEKNC